jgi:hypothetical protein
MGQVVDRVFDRSRLLRLCDGIIGAAGSFSRKRFRFLAWRPLI